MKTILWFDRISRGGKWMESNATIGKDIEVCIHGYVGCGEKKYVTCRKLQMERQDLYTNDLETAKIKAVEVVKKALKDRIYKIQVEKTCLQKILMEE